MHLRFRFKRGEELKFIGHLDILRLFERAFKRSGFQVVHSQGFNPRPQIVFAQPMPIGLTSCGEFADVELQTECNPEEFIKRMNEVLPPGIQLLDAKEKKKKSNIMALTEAARYKIGFEASENTDINKLVNGVLSKDTISVIKSTKSGDKEVNIRPLIYKLTGYMDGNTGIFDVLLGAGQNDNVRPELFLSGVYSATGINPDMNFMHRKMLYAASRNEKKLNLPQLNDKAEWITLLDDSLI